MKGRVGHAPITPASDESFKHIVDRFIDKKLKEGPQMKGVIQRIVNETKVLYEQSMKRSQCEFSMMERQVLEINGFFVLSTTCSRCTECQRT